MTAHPGHRDHAPSTRRDFLKQSSLAAAVTAGGLSLARSAHAAGSDVLRVGVIGCGGRGTGAVVNALKADPNARLVAMADAFGERARQSLQTLTSQAEAQGIASDQLDVDEEHVFDGFDGYRKVFDCDLDVVLLTATPHFRPMHLEAAVAAGAHIFCEKPVAVDGPGARRVLAAVEEAEAKGLNIVSGFCWRYHPAVQETMQRVLDGAIGEIASIQETYLTGALWHRGHEPDWTEMEYQMRNWYYFTWLSGDHNVEQAVHSLDKMVWVMGNQPPQRAWGLGGRQVRVDPRYGHIYDHHAVVYEYPGNVHAHFYTRQQPGCYNHVDDFFFGTKGHCEVLQHQIFGENPWRYRGPGGNMYDLQHVALFNAIREGERINDGQFMTHSTMTAILGRMVNYTGQALTYEEALDSSEELAPADYGWDADPPILPDEEGRYPVAMPGVTPFV